VRESERSALDAYGECLLIPLLCDLKDTKDIHMLEPRYGSGRA
jgi:hypothetical protein